MGPHPPYAGTWVGSLNIFVQPENVLYRVDPTVGTDTVKDSPIELAANMESTELLTLFAEFVDLPPEIKIKLN